MAHNHRHPHHIDPDAGDRKVAVAVLINLALTLAQIVGGIFAGSLSLIADALHNLGDAVALIIAFGARRIARRPADAQMTFGYARIEAVAALINYTTLIVVGVYLVYEGIARIFEPVEVAGWIVILVAGAALVVDLATAVLTYTMSKVSMNIRAAFLHNLADAFGSVAVIVAGALVILFGWYWVDPLVTLLIAGYILWHAGSEMPGVMRLLMLGSPPDIDTQDVIATMRAVPGVASVHHVHLWMMGEHDNALEAHVVLDPAAESGPVRAALRARLDADFHIHHTTFEVEEDCATCTQDANLIGHGN